MFSIVIVTYKKDFDKIRVCLESLRKHLTDPSVPVILILNDTLDHFSLLNDIANLYLPVKILHHSEVAPWDHSLDWWSQQWFKLAISKNMTTPWYLLVDSDDVFVKDLEDSAIFDQDRAKCLTEPIACVTERNNWLIKWLSNSRRRLNLQELPKNTLGNLTPMMMHTHTVRQLCQNVDASWFDSTDPENRVSEFYLYHAWLEKQGLFDKLYSPSSVLDYALDKRGP